MTKRKVSSPAKGVAVKPAPTEKKARAIAAAKAGYDALPARAVYDAEINADKMVMDVRHNDPLGESYLLHAAAGSSSDAWVNNVLLSLGKSGGPRGKAGVSSSDVNASLAFMAAVAPTDEVEAALGVQMYAVHQLAIEMASLCRHTQDRVALIEYGNMATKMMRTFTMQVEALAKSRRGGEQVVRHVHVYEGGQAIVADQFNHYGAGGYGKGFGQPYAPFAGHAPAGGPPMLGEDPAGNGVPITSDQGQEAVQDARRQKSWRAARKPA